MKLLFLLIRAEARNQVGRMALGSAAIFVCVCLIVWLMGSYDQLVKEFDHDASAYMGQYDLCISPLGEKKAIDVALIDAIRNDPAVASAHGSCQLRIPVGVEGKGKTFDDFVRDRMGIPSQSPLVVGGEASHCPYELKEGRWPDMAQESAAVGVLGSASAEFFKVGVGDVLSVRRGAKVYNVKIEGIVEQSQAYPDIGTGLTQGKGPAFASLFVPKAFFEKITEEAFHPNLLSISLSEGGDREAFESRWREKLSASSSCFAGTGDVKMRLENNRSVRRMRDSAQSAVGMVLFSSVFIIFATLSMSVRERSSRFALLRTLGVGKRTIAGLVVGESLLLSIPALAGGLVAGWAFLAIGHSGFSMPSMATVGAASGCALLGALLACILPAWKAAKCSPAEALASSYDSPGGTVSMRRVVKWGGIGVMAWVVQPAVLLLPGLDGETRKFLFSWVGYPCLALGIICLAPACVVLAERFFSKVLARVMSLHPSLLKMQLTSHLEQSAGTAICLTVGLGLFMAVQMWGYSMLVPFLPDRTMPGMLVSVLHAELHPDEAIQLLHRADIDHSRVFPIKVEEPDISPRQLASEAFRTVEQKSVVVAGIPLDRMMTGENPSLTPRFVMGDKDEALEKIKKGKAVIIPDTFARATGLKPGDLLSLCNPAMGGKEEDWKIAGVVALPGWHWLTKTSGMRVRRGHFIAALVIADEAQVSRAYGLDRVRFFWGDAPRSGHAKEIQKKMEEWLNEEKTSQSSPLVKPMAKVTFSRDLEKRVEGMGDRSIQAMSSLPLIALGIASLAVMNAIVASVRSRRRSFGVMRAVGVTRWGLARLIWAEALLIGGSAVLLSFSFALLTAWGSIEVLAHGYFFGGITPPLHIPWGHLACGVSLSLFLCWLAGMAGVWMTARRDIPSLLEEGE